MIKNRFLALAVAVAVMAGTAVPAFAESSNTTTVSLTVAPTNTYTMTVPAKTTLDSEGAVTELTNGIKITNGDLADGKKLTVTATSQNSWTLTAEGVTGGIGYTLYSDAGTTEATSWEFTQAEANAAAGATKKVYAKVNTTDVGTAKPGEYSDVITFTATVENVTTISTVTLNKNTTSKDGVTYSGYSTSLMDTYSGGTISTESGVITRIVVTKSRSINGSTDSGSGWSSDGSTATYTGDKKSSVSFPYDISAVNASSDFSITVTIEK